MQQAIDRFVPFRVQGIIVHTKADRTSALPLELGGPIRVIFPPDVGVQAAICGKPKPVNLKGVCRLELSADPPPRYQLITSWSPSRSVVLLASCGGLFAVGLGVRLLGRRRRG